MSVRQRRLFGVELFARIGGVGDSRRVSYNNVVEVAPGVAIIPGLSRRLVLSLEYVAGRYLTEAFPGSATGFSDVRAMAVFYAVALPGRRPR